MEELGVELISCEPALLERRDEGSPFVIAFVPVEVKGDPAALEHTRIQWGTLGEIARLALAPSDRHFVDSRIADDRRT
jgi:hypothetical protein